MQKSKKPRENQKKQKKTIFQKSGDRVNRQESWNIVFFGFFVFLFFFVFLGFLEIFWIFAFLLLQESWNIVFFDFFVVRVLEYILFFVVFSRFFSCYLFFARNLGQNLVPSEGLEMNSFWYDIVKPQVLLNLAIV